MHPSFVGTPACSEEDADRAHRRIQRLRAFHFGATHFVAALQAYLQSRTAGGVLRTRGAMWAGKTGCCWAAVGHLGSLSVTCCLWGHNFGDSGVLEVLAVVPPSNL